MATDLSIIIAYFNAEATIAETLESVHKESLRSPEIHFTVIAVDDGSTDNSHALVESFKDRLNIKNLQIPHTGTPAAPRNKGIESATTEFIFFLDADDVLLPNGLSTAVKYAVDNNADLVVCRLKSLDGRGVPRGMFSSNSPDMKLTNSRIYWALNPMKVIRRNLVIDNGIRFESGLSRDEDQPFSFKCYLAAKKVSVLADPPTVGVRYVPSGNNLTLRGYSVAELIKYLNVMTSIMDNALPKKSNQNFLMMRHWEIEITRELIWKRLALMPEPEWRTAFNFLNEFSHSRLVPEMLPRISIRWRGIVGLIGSNNFSEIEKLLVARERVLQNRSFASKALGIVQSNWIRLEANMKLPKIFS